MSAAQKLRRDMNNLPVGGALFIAQHEINTSADVMLFRKAAPNAWERLRYPFTEAEPVDETTVAWEVLLVGDAQALLPKPGARLKDFEFIRKSVDKAFAAVDAKGAQA